MVTDLPVIFILAYLSMHSTCSNEINKVKEAFEKFSLQLCLFDVGSYVILVIDILCHSSCFYFLFKDRFTSFSFYKIVDLFI